MKCFIYFLCFWLTFLSVGCASQRSEIPASTDAPVASATNEPVPTSAAPAVEPPAKHPVMDTVGCVLLVPLLPLILPIILLVMWHNGPMC